MYIHKYMVLYVDTLRILHLTARGMDRDEDGQLHSVIWQSSNPANQQTP
jgi:hypothetical protein